MKAYVFPGQGAQFTGMGKDLYETSPLAKELFEKANDILGFRITDIMFEGTAEELKETKVTVPAWLLDLRKVKRDCKVFNLYFRQQSNEFLRDVPPPVNILLQTFSFICDASHVCSDWSKFCRKRKCFEFLLCRLIE